jgi:hypothetical protein
MVNQVLRLRQECWEADTIKQVCCCKGQGVVLGVCEDHRRMEL